MFTVVITEQEHLDSIEEYKAFLRPFLEKTETAFCRWRPDAENLNDAVPQLHQTVACHDRWRLIVLCPEEGLEEKNPFALVSCELPDKPVLSDDENYKQHLEEYLEKTRQVKFAAFEQAMTKPLTRLMTWLCQGPTVTEGRNNAQEDPEFAEYMQEQRKKYELRQQLLRGSVAEITLPAEIICVAKRCCAQTAYDIDTSWKTRPSSLYSRFYDWNMYFDKMRYLVFDILPRSHRNYTFDYIRFLYTVMLLADNEIPLSALSPNRVYTLHCQDNEAALRDLLGRYNNKLISTYQMLGTQVQKLQREEKERLTDKDAEMVFCTGITVPVSTTYDFDHDTLYVSCRKMGLASDCPRSELGSWTEEYRKSRKALTRYLKMPKRAIMRGVTEVRRLEEADLDYAGRLTDTQLEDVEAYTNEEELQMVDVHTCDLYDIDHFVSGLQSQDKRMRTIIERRMTRKWTVSVGLIGLICFLIGFLPMFFSNTATFKSFLFSLIFTAASVAVMALIAYITLFVLRRPVRRGYNNYNGIMNGVIGEVEGSLAEYSEYLSHACNMMRGYSVLNYRKENEDPREYQVRVYQKHMADIQRARAELFDVFGAFVTDLPEDVDPSCCFDYDFTRIVEFPYPIPFDKNCRSSIDFIQSGNKVQAPVDLIKSVKVRREELYD